MKYASWEDMIEAQAIAFCALCTQNERLTELANKADNGYNNMDRTEQNELFTLLDEIHESPFFSARCEKEWAEMDEQEHPEIPEEIPNSWDPLEQESYKDLFDEWWDE